MTDPSYAELVRDRFGPFPDAAWDDAPDSALLRRILGRRTHRAYEKRGVPAPLLRLLGLTALSASAKSDFQQASIITVQDPARRAALAAPFPAMPWIGEAPAFLVFCGDARRLERLGTMRGHKQDNGSLEGFFNAAVDAALVLQTFILAAEGVGLGCCPISVLRNQVDTVAAILELPPKVFPVAGLCVGWPNSAGHVSMRLPPTLTMHTDRYDDANLAAEIDAYDAAREARHPTPRDKQRAPKTFGYADRYGWSEDKARQSAQGEGAAFPPWSMSRILHTRRGILGTAVMGASALALGVRGAAAATLDEIKKRGYMLVATEDDYRPFEFFKDGVATGYDTELLNILRKKAGFEIRQDTIPWTGLLPGIDTGKYDAGVTAALITKERQQYLDFTSPVSDATIYYVKRAKDASINSIKDLSGKTVGVQAGSAMLQALPQLAAMLAKDGGKLGKVVQYVSYPEAYQDLAIGRTDYVTNTVINLKLLVEEKPGIFTVGQPVAGKTYIAWPVKKGNTSVLNFLNAFLAEERKNGEMYKLQKQWLGQSFEDMPESWTAA